MISNSEDTKYECGLPQVYIVGSGSIAVVEVEQIHALITKHLFHKRGPWTWAEISFLRKYHGQAPDREMRPPGPDNKAEETLIVIRREHGSHGKWIISEADGVEHGGPAIPPRGSDLVLAPAPSVSETADLTEKLGDDEGPYGY